MPFAMLIPIHIWYAPKLSVPTQDLRSLTLPPKPYQELYTRLLSLPALGKLLLTTTLSSLWTALGVENVVPPSERTRVVANELLVVSVVVVSAGPEWKEVVQAPREFVTGVSVDGLGKSEDNPDVHGENVEVLSDAAPDDWCTDCTESKNHDFNWRSVLGGQTERSRVLVVDLVDHLVERAPVESAVHPVVP